MFQTVLLFLAPAQGVTPNGQSVNGQSVNDLSSMATRNQPTAAPGWLLRTLGLWVVAGNALGFIAFMSGLGMVLRLAEILLS